MSKRAVSSAQRKSTRNGWRGLLGALLTVFIVVPYMMGSDVEKYLRGWVDAVNQRNGKFHLELLHYQRHWFTSDGDLAITGDPLRAAIPIHFKAYHGPLFFNTGHRLRFGLAFFKGTLDSSTVLGQQNTVNLAGPIQLTAFVPYFSDRELHITLPPLTITDKENDLVYLLNTVDGNLDGDGLLQMELPALTVNRIQGSTLLDMEDGLLRLLPDNHLASLAVKQITVHFKKSDPATFANFMVQANTQTSQPAANQLTLNVAVHFDQFKKPLNHSSAATLLAVGPFELKLGISGLLRDGLMLLADTLKAIGTQSNELTPEQGEALEKGLSNILSHDALFDLTGDLTTPNGKINTQFQGGFKTKTASTPWQHTADLVAAFYSKGTIHLDSGVMQALSQYAANLEHPPEQANWSPEIIALSAMVDWFKQDAQGGGYSSQIEIKDERIQLNGKAIKAKDAP